MQSSRFHRKGLDGIHVSGCNEHVPEPVALVQGSVRNTGHCAFGILEIFTSGIEAADLVAVVGNRRWTGSMCGGNQREASKVE